MVPWDLLTVSERLFEMSYDSKNSLGFLVDKFSELVKKLTSMFFQFFGG